MTAFKAFSDDKAVTLMTFSSAEEYDSILRPQLTIIDGVNNPLTSFGFHADDLFDLIRVMTADVLKPLLVLISLLPCFMAPHCLI